MMFDRHTSNVYRSVFLRSGRDLSLLCDMAGILSTSGRQYLCESVFEGWTLWMSSGGGDLYKGLIEGDAFVYKKLHNPQDIAAVLQVYDRLPRYHDGIAVPVHLVHRRFNVNVFIGYTMRVANGRSLYHFQTTYTDRFPLADVVGRIIVLMAQVADYGLCPLIGHAGNVMVSLENTVQVVLLDSEEWPPMIRPLSVATVVDQLCIVFLNYDRHPLHNELFSSNGRVMRGFSTLRSLLVFCSSFSSTLREYLDMIEGDLNPSSSHRRLPHNDSIDICSSGDEGFEQPRAKRRATSANVVPYEQGLPSHMAASALQATALLDPNAEESGNHEASAQHSGLDPNGPSDIEQPTMSDTNSDWTDWSNDLEDDIAASVDELFAAFQLQRENAMSAGLRSVTAERCQGHHTKDDDGLPRRPAPSCVPQSGPAPGQSRGGNDSAGWRQWIPPVVNDMTRSAAPLHLRLDKSSTHKTLVGEMEKLCAQIDKHFGWTDVELNPRGLVARAATQCIVLLHDRHADESKNELLQVKLIVLVGLDILRCHAFCLFCYHDGHWSRTESFSALTLEWILDVIATATSYALLMARCGPPSRRLKEIEAEIKLIHKHAPRRLLSELYFADTFSKNGTTKSDNWCYGMSELLKGIHRVVSSTSTNILKNFKQWASTPMSLYDQQGIAALDCYMHTRGSLLQVKKSPSNNCYVRVPHHLAWSPPDWAYEELLELLTTTFVHTEGIEILTSLNALAWGREVMPECIICPVGTGQDGKTMVWVDFMGGVWGDAFGEASSTMLQVEREFQQQGHRYVDSAVIVFDECNRELGVQESVAKLFIAHGKLPLRKNHAADTYSASYNLAIKAWLMNAGDIPWVPTAEETSNARRYRAIFHRGEFTGNPDCINPELSIFPVRDDFKPFARSGLAAVTWLQRFVFPTKLSKSPDQLRAGITWPRTDSVLYKDTQWFLKRMSRSTKTNTPDEDEPNTLARSVHTPPPPAVSEEYMDVVTKSLRLMSPQGNGSRRRIWSERDLMKGLGKSTCGVLAQEVERGSYFIRRAEGRLYAGRMVRSYERRLLDIHALLSTTEQFRVRIGPLDNIIGTFAEWNSIGVDAAWLRDDEENVRVFEELDDYTELDCRFNGCDTQPINDRTCNEVIDECRLREYILVGDDPRQVQLERYMDLYEKENAGRIERRHLTRRYRKKDYGICKYGREYPEWLSIVFMSSGGRKAAAPDGTVMCDISNAAFEAAVRLGEQFGLPTVWLKRFNAHKTHWREFISCYYNISTTAAKAHMQPTLYMDPYPPEGKMHMGILPFVHAAAREASDIRSAFCAANPRLVDELASAGRANPQRSAFAIGGLQEIENQFMRQFFDIASRGGAGDPQVVIFDEAWMQPGSEDMVRSAVVEFTQSTGVHIKVSVQSPEMIPMHAVIRRVDRMLHSGSIVEATPLKRVSGKLACLKFVVRNLFGDTPNLDQQLNVLTDGPFGYDELQRAVAGLQFRVVSCPDWTGRVGSYVVHEPSVVEGRHGHATGFVIQEDGQVFCCDITLTRWVVMSRTQLVAIMEGIAHRVTIFACSIGRPNEAAGIANELEDNGLIECLKMKAGGGPSSASFPPSEPARPHTTAHNLRVDTKYTTVPRCGLGLCGGGLKKNANRYLNANVWDGARWNRIVHGASQCRRCNAQHRLNFVWDGPMKRNTITRDMFQNEHSDLIILVSNSSGFTMDYLWQFTIRFYRCNVTLLGEAVTILRAMGGDITDDSLARGLATAWRMYLSFLEGKFIGVPLEGPVIDPEHSVPAKGLHIVFDAWLDDPGFDKTVATRHEVADGNRKMHRKLQDDELPLAVKYMSTSPINKRPAGSESTSLTKRPAAAVPNLQECKGNGRCTACNGDTNVELHDTSRTRTEGVYASVDMSSGEILAFGEMLNKENATYKEQVADTLRNHTKIGIHCHDCGCNQGSWEGVFCDRVFVDAFHVKSHKCSRARWDPIHPRNRAVCAGLNTQAVEHLWRTTNKIAASVNQMDRGFSRMCIKQFCVFWNQSSRLAASGKFKQLRRSKITKPLQAPSASCVSKRMPVKTIRK